MQTHARAVIIGSGIAGSSIAYHLTRLGWRDVVVLEQGELIGGTTSHAPGLVGQLRSSPTLTRMLMYSVSLYRSLSVDGVPGFHGEGSLRLASSKERWAQIRQQAAFARQLGLEARLLGPGETHELFPLLNMDGVEGSLYLPSDGSAEATILAQALIREAQAHGVRFLAHSRVRGIEVVAGEVRSVHVDAGRIQTDTVVVAAGIWSPLVGRLAGVAVPLVPMPHQYAVSAELPELATRTVPNLRDPDHLIYARQRGGGLVFGGYERNPCTFDGDAIPERPDPTVQSFDVTRFEPLRQAMIRRVPVLNDMPMQRTVNGLEAFTSDGEFLLGPAPEVKGFWTACGFCAHGVSSAGGIGMIMAQWLAHGDAGMDVSAMALSRFAGRVPDAETIRQEACRVYGTYYDIPPE